jgi:hypothetical protein
MVSQNVFVMLVVGGGLLMGFLWVMNRIVK